MSDDTNKVDAAAEPNSFEANLEKLSDEQADKLARMVADDQKRRHADARDAETITHGTNAEAREAIQRRYGYRPDY